MGTVEVKKWFPTDSWISIRHEMFIDLEDADDTYIFKAARECATDDLPSDIERSRIERSLRELLEERGGENLTELDLSDLDEYEIRTSWSQKVIEICEWCHSVNCDGDPDDCDQVPDFCEGCDNFTGGECECVWCGRCEQWNNCDHDNEDVDVVTIIELLRPIIAVAEEAKEEETIL